MLFNFKMPRKCVTISKTGEKKLESFFKKINMTDESFINKFKKLVLYDVKNIKECSEKSIIDFYIDIATSKFKNNNDINDEFYKDLVSKVRKKLVEKYASKKSFDNTVDMYFNDVRNVYIEHPQNESNDLEFCPENRDVFIKNNLKLVIECANRYRGLGVPFEDLIQFGNYGLLMAFDRFDKNRANLRQNIIKDIESSYLTEFKYEDVEAIIKKNFVYGKNLDMTLSKIPQNGFSSKEEFIDWSKENIKGAVFASVAFQWIRAQILSGITNYGKIINIPKSIQRDLGTTSIIRLDSINPHTEDCYHDNQMSEYINNEIPIEQEQYEDEEYSNRMKDIVTELLSVLPLLDRRILQKKFGIGYPFPMSLTDIADSEDIPLSKVKCSITNSMKILNDKANTTKYKSEIFS